MDKQQNLENNIDYCKKFDVIHSGRWETNDPYKPKNPDYYLNSKRDKFYKDYKNAIEQELKNAKN